MKIARLIVRSGYSLFLLSYCLAAGSQTLSKPWKTECRISYAIVMKHHMDMGPYTRRHFPAFELSLVQGTQGSSPWQVAYRFPDLGISYFYSGLGESPVLGDVHALTPWIRFPVYQKAATSVSLRTGLGLGYFRKKFDRIENYKNLAIGSHLNAHVHLLLEARRRIQKLTVTTSLGISHFSNGTMFTPNYGVNIPMIGLGFGWNSQNPGIDTVSMPTATPKQKGWNLDINLSHGIKEIHPLFGPKYNIVNVSAGLMRRINIKRIVGFGVELFWDGSELELLRREGVSPSSDLVALKPGLFGLHEWDIGKMKIDLLVGMYLYEKEKSDGPVYDKLLLKYFLMRDLYLSLSLKSHYAKADFIGWGLGLNLPLRNNKR